MNTETVKIENVNKDNNFKEKNKIMLQVRMLTMTAVLAANYVIPSVHRNVLILVKFRWKSIRIIVFTVEDVWKLVLLRQCHNFLGRNDGRHTACSQQRYQY